MMIQNRIGVFENFFDSESWDPPPRKIKGIEELEDSLQLAPQYHVVLLNDNDHTYEYVIEMLMEIFRHSRARAFEMAFEVDIEEKVVVYTATERVAEEKRYQILSYGPDLRLPRSKRSMFAIIEPAK